MSEPNLNDVLSGGGLSSLLQNPEVAAKLPRIMEALGPVIAEMKAEKAVETGASGEEKSGEHNEEKSGGDQKSDGDIAALAGAFSGAKGKGSQAQNRRALLCALEPYLSDSRREAMEYIGKVLTLIDLLTEVM